MDATMTKPAAEVLDYEEVYCDPRRGGEMSVRFMVAKGRRGFNVVRSEGNTLEDAVWFRFATIEEARQEFRWQRGVLAGKGCSVLVRKRTNKGRWVKVG